MDTDIRGGPCGSTLASDDFRTGFDAGFLASYQAGVMRYSYRGLSCWKSPIDLALYMKLLWEAKPATIIEIGSKSGGSALWFADMAQAMGLPCKVVTVDIDPPLGLNDPRISVLRGDALHLEDTLTAELCAQLPRPWWVNEDSAHTFESTGAVLAFFATRLRAGERMIVEDGVLDDLGMSESYRGGPNRALAGFLRDHPDEFEVDRDSCDFSERMSPTVQTPTWSSAEGGPCRWRALEGRRQTGPGASHRYRL